MAKKANSILLKKSAKIKIMIFRFALRRIPIVFFITLFFILSITCIITILNPFPTVFLLGFIMFLGLFLCRRIEINLDDPNLKMLGYFWLIKVVIIFFFIFIFWIPNLDYYLTYFEGADPLRYYWQSLELIENKWSPHSINLNYMGVLYFYGGIFFIFGHNPFAPALVNSFISLIASLYLIKTFYEIKYKRDNRDWLISFILLIPEILFFEVNTSKEILVSSVLVIGILTLGRYFKKTSSISLAQTIIIFTISTIITAAVRTTMVVSIFASAFIFIFFINSPRKFNLTKRLIIGTVVVFIILAAPIISNTIGGYSLDINEIIKKRTQVELRDEYLETRGWTEKSIGRQLVPINIFEAIIYTPIRMILYIITPLPTIDAPLKELFIGDYTSWARLMHALTSIGYICLFPFVISSLIKSIRGGKYTKSNYLLLQIAFWSVFIVVAGGNVMLHPRYRVMSDLFFFGCAWLGFTTSSRKFINQLLLLWCILLITGFIFYVAYKFF